MKRFIAGILCAVMVATSLTCAVFAGDFSLEQDFLHDDTYTLGDVNNDGAINAQDAYLLKSAIVGKETGKAFLIDAADFDADTKCGATDSYSLKLCLSGMKKSEDFENGKQVYRMTIAGHDISEYCIVLPENATSDDNIYFAYLNFMKYIRYLTGVEIPVCYGEATTEKAVYFHNVSMDTELGEHLGYEGYRYEVTEGNLNIYGTYRGNMYAVFDILEDYLGLRFYSNSETFVYKQRTVDIPEGVSVDKIPEINFRYARHTFGRNA